MIFPVLEMESVVRIGDKTRLSGVKSFGLGSIAKVQIKPSAIVAPIVVTGQQNKDWFLDWAYQGLTGDQTVTLLITDEDGGVVSATGIIKVVSEADDLLLSNDQDLEALEPQIRSYVPEGRSSWLNVHREARNKIVEVLGDRGIMNADGQPLTAAVLANKSQARTWSRDLTLSLIYYGMTVTPDDIFAAKAIYYANQAKKREEEAVLSLDLDADGEADEAATSRYQTITTTWLRR